MITEDYVSLKTAKLLKEKGFRQWCHKSYGTAAYHKGVPISFDEECDLKDAGLEDEIEYVEGGFCYDYSYANNKKDTDIWAAPTFQTVMRWLREIHHIFLVVDYNYECTDKSYIYKVYHLGENGKPERFPIWGVSYDIDGNQHKEIVSYRDFELSYFDYATYEEAADEGIKYCLENL